MSPASFCLEYWSALVYQVNQPGVVSLSWSRSVPSENALLPTMLICLMRETSPSSTANVMAARQVLTLQLLFRTVDLRLVEDARLGDADFFQRLGQLFLVEFLDAGEIDSGNRRALFHLHHQYIALSFNADILEEAGSVQGFDRCSALFIGEGLAHAHRQVAENRAGFSTLDAFDTNVLDHERFDSECLIRTKCERGSGDQATGKSRSREMRGM